MPPHDAPTQSIAIHIIIALLALFALLGLAFLQAPTFATLHGSALGESVDNRLAEIGVEYDVPVQIGIAFSKKGTIGHVIVASDDEHGIHISLPQQWKRIEVRGAGLDDVTADAPEFGFTRWALPAGASMSLQTDSIPDQIEFLSPSDHVAAITVDSLDLLTGVQNRQITLLQHESTAELWEE